MTNFEKYKDEITQLANEHKRIAFVNGKIVSCSEIDDCTICKFCSPKDSCNFLIVKWLCEEYIEPIKLTRKQRKFLEFLETGWIVRYESGKLGWYAEKPMWDGFVWVNKPSAPILVIDTQIVDFPFIESENKEPFSVEKMLTLEVEE